MNIVIIGNGISGVTAARYIRKRSKAQINIISSETKHFFSRTALMYIYMGHMKYEDTKPYEDYFWEKNNINLIYSHVNEVNTQEKKLILEDKSSLKYDVLVLALGSKPNKFGWPGQDLKGVTGLFSYQDLQYMENYTQGIERGVIIGGGLIGVEMAEMLISRNIKVSFLVREKLFWHSILPAQEAEMIGNHIKEHHIDLRSEEELAEILSDDQGRVKAVKTKSGKLIDCQFVGLTAGVHPNIKLLQESKNSNIEIDKGILINEYFETNIKDVYAIGDCAQFKTPLPGRRPLEQVWYTGKMHGETVAHTITGKKLKYNPGIWFNSAKFFDIEYQTYGLLPSKLPENEETFFWIDKVTRKKSLRINFDKIFSCCKIF